MTRRSPFAALRGRGPDPRVDDLARRLGDLEREVGRIGPQLAALEARLEDLAAGLAPAPGEVDDARLVEARSLVDEVRAEHARVRARISAAVVFEERLRVLEERAGVDSLTGRVVDPQA